MRRCKNFLIHVLILMIRAYQWLVSPLKTGAHCRFAPSCSSYAVEALQKHGIAKGIWLAIKRISRCHPWGGAGIDEVP